MPDNNNEENGFEDFSNRFTSLMDEALGYGIRSIVALNDNDPLCSEESKTLLYRGGWANSLGLATYAQNAFLSGDPE